MEPVEIEIKMRQNVSEETSRATKGMDAMEKSAKQLDGAFSHPREALRSLKIEIKDQESAVKNLKKNVDDLSKAYKAVAPGQAKTSAAKELNEAKAVYKEQVQILDEMKQKENELAVSSTHLITKQNELKDSLARLRAEGRQNSEEYAVMRDEYEKLLTAMTAIRNETSTRAGMSGMVQGVSGLSGAFSAGAGAMGLFNAESENMAKIQTRVQSLMAITIGLQQASVALNQRSAFMTNTVAKAKLAWANAVKFLNVQLGISNALSKALVASGIGAIIAVVGTLIYKLNDWRKKQEDVNETLNISNEIYKQAAENTAKQVAGIEALRTVVQSETVSQEEKYKAIKKLKDIIPGYNAELDETGRLIKENTTALNDYIASLEKQMRFEAATDKLKSLFAEQMELDLKLEGRQEIGDLDKQVSLKGLSLTQRIAFKYANQKMDSDLKNMQLRREEIQKEVEKIKGLIEDNVFIPNDNKSEQKETDAREKASNRLLQLETEQENERVRIRHEAEQRRIDLMNESAEKALAQNELNYQKELQAASLFTQKMIEKQQEYEKQRYIAETGSDKGFTPSTTDAAGLHPDVQSYIAGWLEAAEEARSKGEKKVLDDSLSNLEDYIAKREKIEREYQQTIADLTTLKERNPENSDAIDRAIVEAEKKRRDALAELQKDTNNVLTRIFSDTSKKSLQQIRELESEAQRFLASLKGDYDSDYEISFGISKEAFEKLKESPKDLEALQKAIVRLKKEGDALEKTFGKIAKGLKGVFASDADEASFAENFRLLQQGASEALSAVDLLADALGNIAELSGSDELAQVANAIGDISGVLSDTLSAAATGAILGGGLGAAIGAGIGLVSSISKLLAENKASREAQKKQIADNARAAYLAEFEINRLYRERYEWAQKIGESQLSYIERNGEELSAQAVANAKEQEELLKKLLGTQYKTGEHFEKTGLFGWGKGKTVTEWGSLAGKTWEEIELLAAQGKLSEEGQAFYEALKAAKEEGADLTQQMEEYAEMVREAFTGSPYESIVSAIVNGFKAGKRSAADFADTFESLMQNAMAEALKMSSDTRIREWYEQFADMASSNEELTQDEIAQLRASWESLIAAMGNEARNLEAITGVSLGDESRTGATNALARASQDSIDELTGGVYAVRMATADIRNNGQQQLNIQESMLAQLVMIAAYCEYLERLDSVQRDIEDIKIRGIKIKT